MIGVLLLSRTLASPCTEARVFLTGARCAGPSLYSRDCQVEAQPGCPTIPFYRAPFYAAALRPLLRFANFQRAWAALNLTAICAALLLMRWELGAGNLLVAAFFAPLLLGYSVGQDNGLQLLVAVSGYALARRNSVAGGLILSLALQKPVSQCLIPVSLWIGRRRPFWGYVTGAGILAALSVAVLGGPGRIPPAIDQYRNLIAHDMADPAWRPTMMGFLSALNVPRAAILGAAGSAIVLIACAVWIRRFDFDRSFLISVGASIVFGFHSIQYDLTLLLLPIYGLERSHAKTFFFLVVCLPLWMLNSLDGRWLAFNFLAVLGAVLLLTKKLERREVPA